METKDSHVDGQLQGDNAARFRKSSWLGVATLLGVMAAYTVLLTAVAILWEPWTAGWEPVEPFWRNPDRLQIMLTTTVPALLAAHLGIVFFIVRVGRKRGVLYYHFGERTEGLGSELYFIFCIVSTLTIVLSFLLAGEIDELFNHLSYLVLLLVGVALSNILPAILLAHLWLRLQAWVATRWGANLMELNPKG